MHGKSRNDGSDTELISRVQLGDRDAFAELYKKNFSSLCDFTHRYVRIPAICEELVQDLFLDIWRQRENWNPKGSVRSYLFKAARNRALDFLKHLEVERRYFRESKIERELSEIEPFDSYELYGSGESAVDPRVLRAIHNAIEQLPEKRKAVFLLSKDDGLTYREIADVLDISVKTVETQMVRAFKTLRTHLSDFLPGFALLSGYLSHWF